MKKTKIIKIILIILVIFIFSYLLYYLKETSYYRTRLIFKIPDESYPIEKTDAHYSICLNCDKIAFKLKKGDKFYVFDGKAGGLYNNIKCSGYSPNDHKLVYIGMNVYETSYKPKLVSYMIINHKEIAKHDAIVDFLFSPDGKKLCYIAKQGEKEFLVINGKRFGEEFDQISDLNFSPDSKDLFYLAKTNDGWNFYKNEEKLSSYKSIYQLKFSKDGKNFAFIARNLPYTSTKKEEFVVLNNKELTHYNEIKYDSFIFSADGNHFAYVGKNGNDNYLVIDEKIVEKHDEVLYNYVFTDDNRFISFIRDKDKYNLLTVKIEKNNYIVEKSKNYEYACCPFLSQDSKRLAYIFKENEKNYLNIDGINLLIEGMPVVVYFSPQNKYVYKFLNKNDKATFVFENGYKTKVYNDAFFFNFISDEKYYFIIRDLDKYCLVINDKEGEWFDEIYIESIKVRENCKYLTYIARKSKDVIFVAEKLK